MREIKFRAWAYASYSGWTMQRSDRCGSLAGFFTHHEGDELMQYTGLKDKNGVEIYEGDIVALSGSSNGVRTSGAVVFKNGGFFIDLGEFGFHSVYRSTMLDPIYSCTGEVIGNIHENPELLETKP